MRNCQKIKRKDFKPGKPYSEGSEGYTKYNYPDYTKQLFRNTTRIKNIKGK